MSAAAVRVEVRPDRVAVLTIDQPGRSANVLTPQLWDELDAALAQLEADPAVRGLVVASGKPGVFIAGADLRFFLNLPGPNDPTCRAYVEQGLAVLDRLERLPFPTCAAIDGVALGGGLEVALACDFRVCGSNPRVQLGLPEVKFGLIPGWGGTQRLPRLVGAESAARMLSSGESLGASEAIRVGLAAAGDPYVGLIGREFTAARHSKRSPIGTAKLSVPPDVPAAVREALAVLTAGAVLSLPEAIRLETEAFLRLAGSDESKRLISEFFARPRPQRGSE